MQVPLLSNALIFVFVDYMTIAASFSPFSPFAAVSLFGVAGLAETFQFFSVSGPFLLDFPGFQVPSDSIFPSQLWSSSRALHHHLYFCNCSDVLSFTSPFDVSKPFQPSPSHNRQLLCDSRIKVFYIFYYSIFIETK